MLQPIILAAGKGTRMHSSLPKVLHEVSGIPMLLLVLGALKKAKNVHPPLIVIGQGAEEIRMRCGNEYTYVIQQNITGTASAVSECILHLKSGTGPVLILYGDHPLIRPESIEKMNATFEKEKPTLALFTTVVPDFNGWRASFSHFGRIVRSADGSVEKIVEYKDANEMGRGIREVNPGVYCVERNWLMKILPRIKPSPITGEYYLTDIVSLATLDAVKVVTVPLPPEEALGVNTQNDILNAEELLRLRQ